MKARWHLAVLLVFCSLVQAQPASNGIGYSLLEGSSLIDDCLICGRPTLFFPLRGTFTLIPLENNPLFTRYRMTNIAFQAQTFGGDKVAITGHGLYQIGGEVAVVQKMELNLQVDSDSLSFTNTTPTVERRFPLLEISLAQTQANLLKFLSLKLVAAPAREIWFSTANGFTPANGDHRGTPGDILSMSGRFVKRYSNLVERLALLPSPTEPGIDAFGVGPAGEFFVSFNYDQTNSSPRRIQHGDLSSTHLISGYVNQTLTREFGHSPESSDVGLDAAIVRNKGDILFSVRDAFFSERLNTIISKGDLLATSGQIVARNAELLSRFHPTTQKDFGLDAVYVWPNGEIWFSTEEGFVDQQLGSIQAGDLLSSEGLVVFRNLELLGTFAPLEDLADFGLDGVFVVTDLAATSAIPRITRIQYLPSTGAVSLEWTGTGKVFQVEKAAQIEGPYQPVSPFLPDLNYTDASPANLGAFFRVRQW